MGTFLGVDEAAQLLGVSTSTIKRMSNNNLLPCIRTPGGHRRFDPISLEWAAMQHLGGTLQPVRPRTTQSDIEELLGMLLRGDVDAASRKLNFNPSRASEIASRLDHELAPAMWLMSDLCQQQGIGTYRERIASSTVVRLLDRLWNMLDQHARAQDESCVAVVGTMQGNYDNVSAQFVATSLRLLPSRAINLGCNLPVATVIKAAHELQARWVCISHTHIESIEQAIKWHEDLKASLPDDTRVIVGGGGLSPYTRRMLRYDAYYETLGDAIAAESTIAKRV